jgi:hypothetical protein
VPSARSQRSSDRHFLLAARRTGEEQIRNVRAGDEQDETDGAKEHEKRRPNTPGRFLVERGRLECPVRWVLVRIGLLQLLTEHRELGLRRLDRNARLEAGGEREPFVRPSAAELLRGEGQRNPHLGRPPEEVAEARRHDADDRVALAVELKGLAHRGRVAGKEAMPEGVAEHDDAVLPRLILTGNDRAPTRRGDAKG